MTFEEFQSTGMGFGDGSHSYYPELRDINDNRVEIKFKPSVEIDLNTVPHQDFIDYEPIPHLEGAFIGIGSFLFIVVAGDNLVNSLPILERALYDLLDAEGQLSLGEHNQC